MTNDLRTYCLAFTFLLSCACYLAQGPKEKVIVNKNCPKLGTSPVLLNELKATDKDMTDYLKTKCGKNFLKTAVEFNLILQPKALPCCKKMVIVDREQIDKSKTDSLLKYVLSFPPFSSLDIDQPKKLSVFVAFDQNFQPSCNFIPAKN